MKRNTIEDKHEHHHRLRVWVGVWQPLGLMVFDSWHKHMDNQQMGYDTLDRKITVKAMAMAGCVGLFSTVLGTEFSQKVWADEGAIAHESAAALQHLTPQIMTTEEDLVELDLLDPDADLSNRHVITDDMVSQDGLTTPSLWWAQSQFGGKLLEHWLAYPGSPDSPRRVDIVVDRQLWGLSTYLQRYTFVNQFGMAAKEFGYNLRVFNDQGNPLASYACNFPPLPSNAPDQRAIASGLPDAAPLNPGINLSTAASDATNPTTHESTIPVQFEPEDLSCTITLDASGAGALRGRTNSFDIFF